MGQALDQLSRPDAVRAGPQRAVAGAPGDRLREGDERRRATLAVTASIGPGALNTDHRGRAGDGEPAARAAAARRHLRHPPAGPGAAAAAAPGRGRRHRQRRVPAGLAVLRPHQPARAAAHRAAARDAGADRPGRHRRRGAVAAPGRPDPRVRLPGRVLRRARLGDPPARSPTRTRSQAVARLLAHARASRSSSPAAASSTPTPPRSWRPSPARPASRCWRPWPARARCSSGPGGRSAGSVWRAPRSTTTWSARPTSCSPSARG